jgi:PqqD family protein of HPr-rel-A system
MRWQLNRLFTITRHDFSEQCVVYHEGSGATHLLSGAGARLFDFLQQTKNSVDLQTLEQYFPEITELEGLLLELQRMHLILTVE